MPSPDDLSPRLRNRIELIPESSCWWWTGHVDNKGYGTFHMTKQCFKAHRMVYEAIVGKIPEGLTLDHLCRNRMCVNPRHLEAVTNQENTKRGIDVGRGPGANERSRTRCPAGHEYLIHGVRRSTRLHPKGYRACLLCGMYKQRERRRREKEKLTEH